MLRGTSGEQIAFHTGIYSNCNTCTTASSLDLTDEMHRHVVTRRVDSVQGLALVLHFTATRGATFSAAVPPESSVHMAIGVVQSTESGLTDTSTLAVLLCSPCLVSRHRIQHANDRTLPAKDSWTHATPRQSLPLHQHAPQSLTVLSNPQLQTSGLENLSFTPSCCYGWHAQPLQHPSLRSPSLPASYLLRSFLIAW